MHSYKELNKDHDNFRVGFPMSFYLPIARSLIFRSHFYEEIKKGDGNLMMNIAR